MTAPADSLAELISAACEMSRAPSPEAHAMALTLFAMKAGAALGCSPDEVKEQLELMRAPPPKPMAMPAHHRAAKARVGDDGLHAAIERVVNGLTLVQVKLLKNDNEREP